MRLGHLLWILFGPGTWGAGGNMVAWVICGVLGFGWLHVKARARDLEQKTQAEKHHREAMELAEEQHQDLKDHVTALVADAQASGGAGSNPAEGLTADERVAPPPATTYHFHFADGTDPAELARKTQQMLRNLGPGDSGLGGVRM